MLYFLFKAVLSLFFLSYHYVLDFAVKFSTNVFMGLHTCSFVEVVSFQCHHLFCACLNFPHCLRSDVAFLPYLGLELSCVYHFILSAIGSFERVNGFDNVDVVDSIYRVAIVDILHVTVDNVNKFDGDAVFEKFDRFDIVVISNVDRIDS